MAKLDLGIQTVLRRPVRLRLRLVDADILLFYSLALFVIGSLQHFFWASAEAYPSRTLFEINAGELLALLAVWSIVKSDKGAIALSKVDLALLSVCALLFVPPEPQRLPFVGATIIGLYFWLRWPRNISLASVGQVWLALSVYEAWGPFVFRIVSAPIIQAESAIVARAGQLLGFGLTLDGILFRAPSGWSVLILEGCSSFHNVSLAVLVWLSLVKLAGAEVTRSRLMALGVGVVTIILLNVLRILLMTPSEESYVFWHEGNGVILFSCLTLMAVAVPTIISLQLHRGWKISATV